MREARSTKREAPRRRIGLSIKAKSPAERLNPQVFRALLHELVTERFNRDVTAAANAIDAARPQPGRKGNYKSDFRPETLYDLIHDRARIKYYHLEAIAHFYHMPVSMLLLFTRVRAELEDGPAGFDKARDIIQASRIFLDALERVISAHEVEVSRGLRSADSTRALNFAAFERLADIFLRDVGAGQGAFSFLKSVEE